MSAKLVEFPRQTVTDVSAGLRALADAIERGDYGDAHNVAWVIDCGNGNIECGLLGTAPECGSTGYMLFGFAMHKLERSSVR